MAKLARKAYATYPAEIEGYTLTKTPSNAKGTFEDESTVTYVYSAGGDMPVNTSTPKPTKTAEPTEKATPKPTKVVKAPSKPVIKSVTNVKGKKMVVKLKAKVKGAKGYQLTYATNSRFTQAKKSVDMKVSKF